MLRLALFITIFACLVSAGATEDFVHGSTTGPSGDQVASEAANQPLWLTLKADVSTKGLRVSLGDIAVVEALDPRLQRLVKRLEIGRFARGRRQLSFERKTIARLVKESFKQIEKVSFSGAQRVLIRPKTVRVGSQRLRSQVDHHLRIALKDQEGVGVIRPLRVLQGVDVPVADFRIELRVRPDTKNARYAGRVDLAVEIFVDGELAEVVDTPMLIERKGRVVVAKRRIRRGRAVGFDDLELREIEIGLGSQDYYESMQAVVGMLAKINLEPGQALAKNTLQQQPVIRRGDVVTARVAIGGFVAKTLCRATQDGAPGDRITLVNVESKKTVYGVVADSRTVDAVVNP